MRVRQVPVPEGFKPVRLEITFETQQELDAMGTLMNYYPMTNALEKAFNLDVTAIAESCEKLGADIHQTGLIDREV